MECVCTLRREERSDCLPPRPGGGRKTIYLHAIIAFTGIQNSIFLIWLKHRLQQVAENGRMKKEFYIHI